MGGGAGRAAATGPAARGAAGGGVAGAQDRAAKASPRCLPMISRGGRAANRPPGTEASGSALAPLFDATTSLGAWPGGGHSTYAPAAAAAAKLIQPIKVFLRTARCPPPIDSGLQRTPGLLWIGTRRADVIRASSLIPQADDNAVSNPWPDGSTPPRSSTIVITKDDGGIIGA